MDAGGGAPALDASIVTNRVFANVRLSGVADTSHAIIDAPTAVVHSAASRDGSAFWLGTAGGLRYVATPGSGATSVEVDGGDARQLLITENRTELALALYSTSGAQNTADKAFDYGLLPTGPTSPSAMVTLMPTDVVNGFVLDNASAVVSGPDVLYALSTGEGLLRKYSFDGVVWVFRGSLATDAFNIASYNVGGIVNIFLTSPSSLQMLTDNLFSDFPIDASPIVILANARTNTAFRGVDVALDEGVPEPLSMRLLILGGLVAQNAAFFRRRRQKSQR
jgi:hypothetical protein